MTNLWLLKNNKEPTYSDCIGVVVAADTELEARHIYPEPDDIRLGVEIYNNIKYDPVIHCIEQTPEYWFIRDPKSEHPDDPTYQLWCDEKANPDWNVYNIVVTYIGTTNLEPNTVILSSNVGS